MAKPENPYAFPWRCDDNTQAGDSGMELRDWFAGQALSFINVDDASEAARKTGKSTPDFVAGLAYSLADAMLRARQATDREDGK